MAESALARLPFCRSEKPSFKGLSGWVFEQTIHSCLLNELNGSGIHTKIEEQAKLGGRTTADLLIGASAAIEIKARGLFAPNAADKC